MKCVILQPSYIPWRGYFYLIDQADLFIFYDDVKYDKNGWRNRNRIRTAAGRRWLSIPVYTKGVESQHIPINRIEICWTKPWNDSHWSILRSAYQAAPFYPQVAEMLQPLYHSHPHLLADFVIETTIHLARWMGIHHTRFMRSSEMQGIEGSKTDRLIRILEQVGAQEYLSGPSARDYIEPEKFQSAGIALEYAEYHFKEYPQLEAPFDPELSILDLLFMTGQGAIEHIQPAVG